MGKKLFWISGTKAIAILAVVLVHCNGSMYTNEYIAMATSFSVTLFVLISGYSSGLSYLRNPNRALGERISKIVPLIEDYVLATVIISLVYNRGFDITATIKHILCFDIEGSYYFVFFFLQLKLVSDILCKSIDWIYSKSQALAWLSLLPVAVLSSLFVNYTRLLPLYGGGKNLLGGTYFFVYYLGILISRVDLTFLKNIYICMTAVICWFAMSVLIFKHSLPIDRLLRPFWGNGDNPPSVAYIGFSLLTFILCYIVFNYMEQVKWTIVKIIEKCVVLIGDNTYSVFLYHLTLLKLMSSLCYGNKLLMRAVVFPLLFIIPVLFSLAEQKAKREIRAMLESD